MAAKPEHGLGRFGGQAGSGRTWLATASAGLVRLTARLAQLERVQLSCWLDCPSNSPSAHKLFSRSRA